MGNIKLPSVAGYVYSRDCRNKWCVQGRTLEGSHIWVYRDKLGKWVSHTKHFTRIETSDSPDEAVTKLIEQAILESGYPGSAVPVRPKFNCKPMKDNTLAYEYVWSRSKKLFRVKDRKISHHCIYVKQLGESRFASFTDHFNYVQEVEADTPDKAVDKLIKQTID